MTVVGHFKSADTVFKTIKTRFFAPVSSFDGVNIAGKQQPGSDVRGWAEIGVVRAGMAAPWRLLGTVSSCPT